MEYKLLGDKFNITHSFIISAKIFVKKTGTSFCRYYFYSL